MSQWKRIRTIAGTMLLLLFTLVLGGQPAVAAEPGQGRLPLKYYWPTYIPRELLIQPSGSFASETLYMLKLQQSGGGQFDVTISGGAASEPPTRSGQAVTVRGQRGVAYTTGAGYTVIWVEEAQVYAVSGGLGLQETLAIANGLEQVDLATWQRRLTGAGTRPSIYYASSGSIYEIRADGSTRRLARIRAQGTVHDAVDNGLRTIVLSEQGLQTVVPQDGAGLIAQFTKGSAQFGRLLGTSDNSSVIYQYVREERSSPTGFASVIGVIDGRTLAARKVYGSDIGQSSAVGLSADGRGLYVIDWGQDPAFGQIKLVSLANGKLLRTIAVDGYAFAVESPDRRSFVTMNVAANELKLYNLAAPSRRPQTIKMTKRGAFVRNMLWAPDSKAIYVTAGSNELPDGPGDLYRVEPATGRQTLVATGLRADGGLLTTDLAGRWLLSRDGAGIQALDLTSGKSTRISVPQDAVVFRWR